MKFSIGVNQKQAIELGITNVNQAVIFDFLTGLSTWATPVLVDGEVFYWAARQVICDELPLLNLKPDTVYRHLKSLVDLGLILHVKSGKKDCVKLTKKASFYYVGNKSEKADFTMSEINPKNDGKLGNKSEKTSKLGNKSEKNSDLNPTYQLTKNKSVKSSSAPRPVDNFSSNSLNFSAELRHALADCRHENGVKIFGVAQMTSPRCFAMVMEWQKQGVTVDDVKLVVSQVMARGVDLKSPVYLAGPMRDWLTEKSGEGEKRRERVRLPTDDNALVAWARKHGFSEAEPGETFFQYRPRLQGELDRKKGAA